MALDPETIARELEKIPRFDVTGVITSSRLLEKDNECLHTYESILDTGYEQTTFVYGVLANVCTTDSYFEIEEKPFQRNTDVTLNLTQDKPHQLVSSDVHYTPSFTMMPCYAVGIVILLLCISGVILAIIKKRGSKKSL